MKTKHRPDAAAKMLAFEQTGKSGNVLDIDRK
jgi:hypothetical protein